MLPAISADLPAYLLPPRVGEDGPQTSTEPSFGPSARAEFSGSVAADAASKEPGNGLYGPDGQFVEPAARRVTEQRAPNDESQTARHRDLALAEFEAVIPPAAREELRALADRIGRRAESKDLDPQDYKQIAELMDRVGRYDDARRALATAEELENGSAAQPNADELNEATEES